jgi:hypothetical protein
MKKILTAAAPLVLAAVMAGCGGSGDENKSVGVDESCASSLTPMACQYRNTMAALPQSAQDFWRNRSEAIAYQGGYFTDAYDTSSFAELMSAQGFVTGSLKASPNVTETQSYIPDYDITTKGFEGANAISGKLSDDFFVMFILSGYTSDINMLDEIFGLKVPSEKLAAIMTVYQYNNTIGDLTALTDEYYNSLISGGVFKQEECTLATQKSWGTEYTCETSDGNGNALMLYSEVDDEDGDGATQLITCTDSRVAPLTGYACGGDGGGLLGTWGGR